MNYSNFKPYDVANGVGVRVSLFVSGCEHACPGCFNPEAWQFGFGEPYGEAAERQVLEALRPGHIRWLTLLGGEPLLPRNRARVLALTERVRREAPGKDIWCYTGYHFDKELLPESGRDGTLRRLLEAIDVLVDGRFVLARKSMNVRFRGSENQRILLCGESLRAGKAVLAEEYG
ncbi:MAG: anaerobic ribonucleoside-triphosphate reductase activating protein [Oscillospiraceae bacterium]|jgi:anaerobic ribonucleoside-triphosphate reductase activating protein|nr:anaerobic ribonucleoside-triphosphate reductase activating protein [Oscillospiraceae bacterium]